ncbi:MAG: hypothetical protein U0X92_11585 [Anaerolineales bacterium]
MIVFLLTGLWHGIAVEFFLQGLLHGFFIMLENLFLNRWLRNSFRPIRHIYVLGALMFTWLIFRAPILIMWAISCFCFCSDRIKRRINFHFLRLARFRSSNRHFL